jgi:hypothetical protein
MDSLREIWAEEGPEKIISWYMESDRPAAELTDEERSWVALAFAMREWNEEAIEMADQIKEDSARGEYARGVALWTLEQFRRCAGVSKLKITWAERSCLRFIWL